VVLNLDADLPGLVVAARIPGVVQPQRRIAVEFVVTAAAVVTATTVTATTMTTTTTTTTTTVTATTMTTTTMTAATSAAVLAATAATAVARTRIGTRGTESHHRDGGGCDESILQHCF